MLELIATSTFGLESIVKKEVIDLGYEVIKVEDGKITFKGEIEDIAKANLWLRCADRVLIKMAEFEAKTFEQLFQGVKEIAWEDWIPVKGRFIVSGKSVKSTLFSVRDCQSITEKAIIKRLQHYYDVDWFEKSGEEYQIQVSLLKDIATITLDTTGAGLHKRGYRIQSVSAPLKETLAAALVKISYWNHSRILIDPFCGSGTIAIEAALIGRNIAPGLTRSFDSEKWSCIDNNYWKKARKQAYESINYDRDLNIYASDIDEEAIKIATENAIEAGVDDCIKFEVKSVSDIRVDNNYGVMITNPPYGKRIGEIKELIGLYKELRRIFRNKNTWSLYVITSDERFEEVYGKKANKKRKLYNGRLKVDYYQYFGERPPK